MTEKRFYTDGQYVMQDREVYVICNGEHNADVVATALNELLTENEQLKEEKEFWKGDACKYSNYLSILSMDCQIVQEAIWDLKKAIDELDNKFDELNQHRLRIYYTDIGKRYCKNCKNLGLDGMFGLICDVNGNNKNYDCSKYEEKE